MNDRARRHIDSRRIAVNERIRSRDKQQDVLSIPIGDLVVVPDTAPQAIVCNVAIFREHLYPILGPLFVDMPDAALTGYRSRKQNCVR